MLDDKYLLETYEPWQQLLRPFESLTPAEAKIVFKEFLRVLDERCRWWERTADLAGIVWPRDSDEFIIAGWRLIKDGYADDLLEGNSGGMWIALGFDWACHASEIVRKRHDLKWRVSTGNVSSRNYPELAGFQNAHKTYGLCFLQGSQNRFQSTDHNPPYPLRELASTYKSATGVPRNLDHLAPLGLPPRPRSYLANEPPQPDAASQQGGS